MSRKRREIDLLDTYCYRYQINPNRLLDDNIREDEQMMGWLECYHVDKGVMLTTEEAYAKCTRFCKDYPGKPEKVDQEHMLEYMISNTLYIPNIELLEVTPDGREIPLYWFEVYRDHTLDYLGDFWDKNYFPSFFVFRLRKRSFEEVPLFFDAIMKVHFENNVREFALFLKAIFYDFDLVGTYYDEIRNDWTKMRLGVVPRKRNFVVVDHALIAFLRIESRELCFDTTGKTKWFTELEKKLGMPNKSIYNKVSDYRTSEQKFYKDLLERYKFICFSLMETPKAKELAENYFRTAQLQFN